MDESELPADGINYHSCRDGDKQPTRRGVLTAAVIAGVGAALTPLLDGCNGQSKQASRASAASSVPTTAPPPALADGGPVSMTLTINGQSKTIDLEPRVTLLDALREHLNMPGTKKGCDHGQCGACTVLVGGIRVNSCLTLAIMHRGEQITTIEGLEQGGQLHPVQAAFIEHDGFQCGYCTPGQICSAVGLIKEGHAKTDDDIREQMAGNICRCGAYVNIVAAVKDAMSKA
jgi:xanthine dehydrogenase YagT iron-sulfur-binding subunit